MAICCSTSCVQEVPVLGIEPAANVAKAAVEKGVPTMVRFFGATVANELVAEGQQADLVIGNNVLAQVPDLNDFVEGLKILLKPDGVLTLEFPHLLRLIELNEFDTIYHEHFSYFSLLTTIRILEAHGLRVFDVEELKSHGGSLRVFACRANSQAHALMPSVQKVIADETMRLGSDRMEGYESSLRRCKKTKIATRRLPAYCRQRRQNSSRLRRAGKERHASALLRHRQGSDRVHGRPQPLQTGAISAGKPHSDLPPRSDSRNQARLCAHSSLESEG